MAGSKWFLGAAVSLLAASAFAHTHLKASTPAKGSTVKAPEQIVLNFSAPARVTAMSIQKVGQKVDEAEQKLAPLPAEAAAQVSVPAPKLSAGNYVVTYRMVSGDGHVMSGKLEFTVAN